MLTQDEIRRERELERIREEERIRVREQHKRREHNLEQSTKFQNAREAFRAGDYKKALRLAKDFRMHVTKEQRDIMSVGYECIVHPEFYRQLGMNTEEKIQEAIQVAREVLVIDWNGSETTRKVAAGLKALKRMIYGKEDE